MMKNSKNLNGLIVFVFFLILVTVISGFVLIFSKKSIFLELQIVLSIIAFSLFVFFFIALYKGIGLKNTIDYLQTIKNGNEKFKHFFRRFQDFLSFDFGSSDLEMPLIGIIFFIIKIIAATFMFIILFISFSSALIWGILIGFIFLYYLAFQAFRTVLSKGNKTQNSILKSLGNSLLFTILYTSWLFIILFFVKKYHN
jgi:hypothetical protein